MIIMEVVELGISGSKSVGKPEEAPKLKDEKELKPVSMRVRDAAEGLLALILEQVGYFPSECGPQSVSSLLDEVSLVKYCNSGPDTTLGTITYEAAVQKFRYFVTDNAILLALLEEPLGNDQDPQPTITRELEVFGVNFDEFSNLYLPPLSHLLSDNPRPFRTTFLDDADASLTTKQVRLKVPPG